MKSASATRGMTLIELLLALAGTSLVGAAVASMLVAVSYGASSSRDMRSLVAANKSINARLSAAVRGSQMVLEKGDHYLILWMADEDDDGFPSIREIRRIEYDPVSHELASYTAVNHVSETTFSFTDNFDSLTLQWIDGEIMQRELWASGVTAWEVTLDQPIAQDSRLLSIIFDLSMGVIQDTAINTVSLRTPAGAAP